VGDQDVVPDSPRLGAAVANLTLVPVTGVTWSELANAVPENRAAPGLVVGNPELHLGPESLEHELAVADKVLDVLLLVQQTSVPVMEALRQVPVEERDHGLDVVGQQLVDEVDVVLQALVVDGVITTAERNHARPGHAKAVCFRSEGFEQGDVGFVDVVGVAGHFAAGAVGDFARDLAELVPDGVAAAVFVSGAFDLVAGLVLGWEFAELEHFELTSQ
jgi:hypothetical protein